MPLTHKINVDITGILLLPVKIVCGQVTGFFSHSLLDTGAGLCHITYPAWRDIGMNELCFNDNQTLMNLMGIYGMKRGNSSPCCISSNT